MYEFGDVILTEITFTDQSIAKRRPALVLFEEHDNIIVAGITSNLKMQGISLSVDEGAVRESIIKTNYLFTVGKSIIVRKLFKLKKEKKKISLLVFSSIFIVLGALILIFLNWTTGLMMHVTFALFNNMTSAQYIVIGFAGLFLLLGVVLGVLGLKVKSEDS